VCAVRKYKQQYACIFPSEINNVLSITDALSVTAAWNISILVPVITSSILVAI
jgi:hypothetical protein